MSGQDAAADVLAGRWAHAAASLSFALPVENPWHRRATLRSSLPGGGGGGGSARREAPGAMAGGSSDASGQLAPPAAGGAPAGVAGLVARAKAFLRQQRRYVHERQAVVAAACDEWRAGVAALGAEADSGRRARQAGLLRQVSRTDYLSGALGNRPCRGGMWLLWQ
jgi:hypothetical protein